MNKFKIIVLTLFLATISCLYTNYTTIYTKGPKKYVYEPYFEDMGSDWNLFIKALIFVESKGRWDAIGKKNDVGILQLTPIAVKDANRIIGYDKYNLADRLDSIKSVDMFTIIQNHYNPERDYYKALKIWNPRAGMQYHNKVMNKFKELCEKM